MQPSYPFTFNVAQWGLVAFVLAMAFFSGVLGGYLVGLTHTARGDGEQNAKSIWTFDDEE